MIRAFTPATQAKREREKEKGHSKDKETIHFAACRHNQLPASRKGMITKADLDRSGQTSIGFTARELRESEKRNQAIGNSRNSNARESSETADSECPSLLASFYPNYNQILD